MTPRLLPPQEQQPDLGYLLDIWLKDLTYQGKAPGTLKVYAEGVTMFLRWCEATGTPAELTKPNVRDFIIELADAGNASATVLSRHSAVRIYAAWLTEEGEFDRNPLQGMKPPKLVKKPVPKLDDDELRRLVKACDGKTLKDRRDEAIVRLMLETGLRCKEVLGMQTTDVKVDRQTALVLGKGGKPRFVSFGPQTTKAIERYMRMRRRIDDSDGPLWIGVGGRGGHTFGYGGLYQMLGARAESAGIKGFHPHRLRHTTASRWLGAGGSEGGLMAMLGWASMRMVHLYVEDTKMERAAAEARTLNLGEL